MSELAKSRKFSVTFEPWICAESIMDRSVYV